jgi:protein phosphatase
MLKLESGIATDPGLTRIENQDQVWAQVFQPSDGEPLGLFIVCDGVGGHHGGKFASHWAIEAIKTEFEDLFCPDNPRQTVLLSQEDKNPDSKDITRVSEIRKLEDTVRLAVQNANHVVYEYALEKPALAADAGTTVTMAVILGNRAVIANVGDSRTYLFRDGTIRQITQDHSLVATLVASGQLEPDDVYTHPQRNLIFRSLGQKNDIQVDTFVELLKIGDQLLLCSDGLWEMIRDEKTLARLVQEADSPTSACISLIEAANNAGGQDNIGVVVVAVQ